MDLLKVELLKAKKFSLIPLAILAPIPAIVFAAKFFKVISGEIEGVSIFKALMQISSTMYVGMFLPILIIYGVCSVTKIENENNGWKQLMTMPIKKWKIYFSKNLINILIVGASLVTYYISCLLGAYILSGKWYFESGELIKIGKVFLTLLPIIILLFAVARIFKSIAVSLGVGVVLMLSTLFIAQSKYWIFAPWTYPVVLSSASISARENIIILLVSILLAVLLFFGDLYNFTTKDVI